MITRSSPKVDLLVTQNISRAWLLWKRIKGLSHTSLRSKRLRAVSQAYSHIKISRMHRKPNFRTHRAPLRLLDARVLLIQAARGEHANGRGSLLLFSPRVSSRFLPSRQKNWHLKQARTCLVPNTYCVFPCEERILAYITRALWGKRGKLFEKN